MPTPDTDTTVALTTTAGIINFNAGKDTDSNTYTLHSTPRVNGAAVDVTNPMPVSDAAAATNAGTDGTGITPPAGGSGVRGFLSGMYKALSGGLLGVLQTGSTGIDYSANPIAIPLAGNVLLATIPASPTRAAAEVQNLSSTNVVQVVRDDGLGGNTTSILLGPGPVSGQPGGYWSSTTFKGRVRVYAPSGTPVSVDQD